MCVKYDQPSAERRTLNDHKTKTLITLFATDSLNPYLERFEELGLKVDDFLGNPATEGIEHQMLYIEIENGMEPEAVLGLR